MALPDWPAGQLRPGMTFTWEHAGDLTGATITGKLRDLQTNTTRAIAGVLTVTDGPNLQFSFDPDAADVVAGNYEVQFNADFPAGATPAKTLKTTWYVEESL